MQNNGHFQRTICPDVPGGADISAKSLHQFFFAGYLLAPQGDQ
jgi:hypothetical protein